MAHAMDEASNIRRLEAQFESDNKKIGEAAERACGEADRVIQSADARKASPTGKFRIGTGQQRRPKIEDKPGKASP